jgi:glycosyltransferase involved in cell wall biosynthesis
MINKIQSPTSKPTKALSIIITNYNTVKFVKFLLYAIRTLTYNKVTIYIHDNGSAEKQLKSLIKYCRKYYREDLVLILTKETSGSSFAHGKALDRTINLVETEYFCILDSDCVPLIKNWDKMLIDRLEQGISVIGSPFYSTKGATHKKYTDFPGQFFVMFRTKDYFVAETTCKAYDTFKNDTCMQWRPDFIAKGLKYEVFGQISTREQFVPEVSPVVCVCYYLSGKLIGSHFGRGSLGVSPKYKLNVILSKIPVARFFFGMIKTKAEIVHWKIKLTKLINSNT